LSQAIHHQNPCSEGAATDLWDLQGFRSRSTEDEGRKDKANGAVDIGAF